MRAAFSLCLIALPGKDTGGDVSFIILIPFTGAGDYIYGRGI